MSVIIPKDAILIFVNQLAEVLNTVQSIPEEIRYERLPRHVVDRVDSAKKMASEGNIEAAISILTKAVSECPNYSRGRLQLAYWQSKQGNTSIALFSAGHAFATAKDKDTKCQLLTLAGDLAVALHKSTRRKIELANAIVFYRRALFEDPSNPHPAWNMIEAQRKLGDGSPDQTLQLLDHIITQCEQNPGAHTVKLNKILKDWDNVLGDNFKERRKKMEELSTIVLETSTGDSSYARSRLIRRTLTAAAVAAGLVILANAPEFVDSSFNQGPTVVEDVSKYMDEDSEKIEENKDEVEVIRAGIEFEDRELKIVGVEFDDFELS